MRMSNGVFMCDFKAGDLLVPLSNDAEYIWNFVLEDSALDKLLSTIHNNFSKQILGTKYKTALTVHVSDSPIDYPMETMADYSLVLWSDTSPCGEASMIYVLEVFLPNEVFNELEVELTCIAELRGGNARIGQLLLSEVFKKL